VGTPPLGAGRYGQVDLAGEVWQLTLDVYAGYGPTCNDCATLSGGTDRVSRGGYYGGGGMVLLPLDRNPLPIEQRDPTVGFRCARVP
jgi:formylglycine-generating enzyme required for sulfatase activity